MSGATVLAIHCLSSHQYSMSCRGPLLFRVRPSGDSWSNSLGDSWSKPCRHIRGFVVALY
eukprot:10375592-Alexandrium_andersonii.AAC.1